MKPVARGSHEIEARRGQVERSLSEIRGALDDEIGFVPRGSWWFPILAAGVGVAVGLVVRRKLRTRPEEDL